MYCKETDEYVNDNDCLKCESIDCEYRFELLKKKENMERIRNSEFYAEIKKRLVGLLNFEEERVNKLLDDLFVSVVQHTQNELQNCLQAVAEIKVAEYIEKKAQKTLDEYFAKALTDEVVLLQKDDTTITTKAQEIILRKFKDFFATKDRRGKLDISSSLDVLITKAVEEKVNTAIEEIKTESIEKFNKEAMKKMMAGMANAINQDKRLLAVLGTE